MNSASFGIIGQFSIGAAGEFGAEPHIREAPAEPRGRIVRMPRAQAGQREFLHRAPGVDNERKLARGRGAAQEIEEDLIGLRTSVA